MASTQTNTEAGGASSSGAAASGEAQPPALMEGKLRFFFGGALNIEGDCSAKEFGYQAGGCHSIVPFDNDPWMGNDGDIQKHFREMWMAEVRERNLTCLIRVEEDPSV